ncbi:ATP synthase F1 subuint delta [Leptolyngbya boryana NIES-2135]|jgi:F-type H+-transporting ATPase subunit delta|uniref:ATP synthase subunit delta n=1 Tax=Leptolyngbya boryana NIES-2135 TaxID=1973484 RepID=A0A1Z4JN03_LEPBY|nr:MULTISPECIES: ATP synthase F1 subunit delta [Leptolyngbya]BAY58028.1 ATP synthase F1 subuint delta [Leptolyngbya boryana NIES-2135]MBD2367470.1 F0F1 ATP synthase subunit delta [Leptolyngbya sp. FACHB-161]MBD2373994.1 F0F1 ATP synthase subunit delta [Leptolyngbya sp. FACHB-238]MBD2398206.1 F0F1 ATP synthase subunit delta [Leptolyngbya sp. FACHB-239]MBD2404297.1 F0F1 ATP synthase subunit delta [Leptolyngbya sp. FACHB-402]
MAESILTSEVLEPYAQALMSLGQSNDLVDRFGEDVTNILDTLNASEDLKAFITNPLAKGDLKKAVLAQVFGEAVHPFTRNFLMLLVDRRRVMFLEGICQQYQKLLRKLKQAVLAEVTSTVELNDDQKNAVRDKVKALTNASSVDIETKIDPDLIGGVIIKVGSQVIDASLRGQLRRITLRLTSAT